MRNRNPALKPEFLGWLPPSSAFLLMSSSTRLVLLWYSWMRSSRVSLKAKKRTWARRAWSSNLDGPAFGHHSEVSALDAISVLISHSGSSFAGPGSQAFVDEHKIQNGSKHSAIWPASSEGGRGGLKSFGRDPWEAGLGVEV